jgi:hypothetical protein
VEPVVHPGPEAELGEAIGPCPNEQHRHVPVAQLILVALGEHLDARRGLVELELEVVKQAGDGGGILRGGAANCGHVGHAESMSPPVGL